MKSLGRGGARALACVAVLSAALALILSGCGSSSSSKSSSSSGSSQSSSAAASSSGPAAAKPTGTPIKTMTIASVNYNGPTYQNILETAKLYAEYINAHGGIAGHPLDAMTCDEMGVPSGTATCARKATAAGVVADVGSFSFNDATAIPIYAAAKTAWFGSCCQVSPLAFHSPYAFDLGNNPALVAGGPAAAAASGCKHIGDLELDLPTDPALNAIFNATAKAAGYTGTIKYVKVPLTTQDLTSEVTQVTTGTDCVVLYLTENAVSAAMAAFANTAHTQRLFGPQGNFDATSVKGVESLVKNDIIYGEYPDLSSPVFADYRAAIAQYKPPSKLVYDSLGGLGTWTAFRAFTNIVKTITGPVNNTTFVAALRKATDVQTGGALPPINFTKDYTGLGGAFPRAFNRNEIYLENPADPHQLTGFVDLSTLMNGQADATATNALKAVK